MPNRNARINHDRPTLVSITIVAIPRWDQTRTMNRILLVIAALSLSGCLSNTLGLNLGGDNVRMTAEHAQFIKKAGVISFIEPQPRVHFVASSLKESNIDRIELDNWDATTTITELMEGRLRQKGYEVVKIDAGIEVKDAYSSSSSFAEGDRMRDQLVAVGKAHGVDMLLVVYRQLTKDFIGKTSQKIISYGLYKRHTEDGVYAYSTVQVEAININKGYVLGKADAKVKIELDSSAWQQNFETDEGPFRLSAIQTQAAQEKLIEALTDSAMIAGQEAGVTN